MTAKKAITMSESRTLSTSSIVTVPVTTIALWISSAKLLLSASVSVSTSFVKRLISSPCVCASK